MEKLSAVCGGTPSASARAARMVPPCVTAIMSRPRYSAVARSIAGTTRATRSAKLSPPPALLPLPFAQMLFGQSRHLERLDAGKAVGCRGKDRGGGLFGAQQIAGQPDRLGRYLARKNAKYLRIAAVTAQV